MKVQSRTLLSNICRAAGHTCICSSSPFLRDASSQDFQWLVPARPISVDMDGALRAASIPGATEAPTPAVVTLRVEAFPVLSGGAIAIFPCTG